jgi:hypothetical protein
MQGIWLFAIPVRAERQDAARRWSRFLRLPHAPERVATLGSNGPARCHQSSARAAVTGGPARIAATVTLCCRAFSAVLQWKAPRPS